MIINTQSTYTQKIVEFANSIDPDEVTYNMPIHVMQMCFM